MQNQKHRQRGRNINNKSNELNATRSDSGKQRNEMNIKIEPELCRVTKKENKQTSIMHEFPLQKHKNQ